MPSADEQAIEKYVLAGKIAKEAREFGVATVRVGGSCLELADAIEGLIRERGARCAFPVNIGINEIAAHYAPTKTNDRIIRSGDVIKLDVGAHIDGYPADTSATVEVGTKNHSRLIEAADDALRTCIEMLSPGTTLSSLGGATARTITAAGFRPVQNLTGHSLERWSLHAGLSIPNIDNHDHGTIAKGTVVAIEPFSSTGSGKVVGSGRGSIFRIVRERRSTPEVDALFEKIRHEFGPFPFASRWCAELAPNADVLVQKMLRLGMIMNYPVLSEVRGSFVAQSEHSVLVTDGGCRVMT